MDMPLSLILMKIDNVPGLKLEILTANEVFTSHEHGDHNARVKSEACKSVRRNSISSNASGVVP